MDKTNFLLTQGQACADAKLHLSNYLLGYGGQNLLALRTLAMFDGWQRLAQDKLANKARSLTDVFDDDVLLAVSMGWLDVNEVAAKVVQQLEAAKG